MGNAFNWDITVSMWHSIQSCVPNLSGSVADRIGQQLQCHQWIAAVPGRGGCATGDTFDLETWHPALSVVTVEDYIDTHCLNQLGA